MHFNTLRLSGFKSFLEQTELEISSGLTGVVGPNGCGKSNLVEALRWVMGESSAKRMRGGEMDDVIFGGSDNRPARNLAEVSLTLDNSARNAPAQFNDGETVDVTRRIERGQGSDYRVNNKGVRAKDVALLFQDCGTGPNSSSLVSQGRIGALIAAKPTERRILIEEAAGITGLHTRRHEAELRLKSAETNLTRVDDVMGTMDAQLQLLRRQARQASRYRNINTEVRRQEAALLYLRWEALSQELVDANEAFTASDARVSSLMLDVARYENERLQSAESLPPLRQEEATSAAALQRLVIAREQIDAEVVRVASATESARQRQIHAEADRTREASLAEDAAKAIEQIEAERASLTEAGAGVDAKRAELLARAEAAIATRQAAEAVVAEIQQQLAMAEAAIAAHNRREADIAQRRARASQRQSQIALERARIEDAPMSDLFVSAAHKDAQEAEALLALATTGIDQAEAARSASEEQLSSARTASQQAEAAVSTLSAERKAIERMLASSQSNHPPVLESVTAQPGYEQALATALGEDLTLPVDESASVYWQNLPAYDNPPALPPGVRALSELVSAPAELSRRLSMVGVVQDAAQAALFAEALLPGQCLVTPEGAAWRWDGVVVKPGAPTVAALRLKQRNRLQEITAQLADAERHLEEARSQLSAAQAASADVAQNVRSAREQHNAAQAAVNRTRRAASEAEAALSAFTTKLAAVAESEQRILTEIAEIDGEAAEVAAERASLPDVNTTRTALADRRAELANAQAAAADAEAARRQFEREEEQRAYRLTTLANDRERWIERASGASLRMQELAERASQAAAEVAELASRPAQLEAQRTALVEQIEIAEEARKISADKLAVAENELRDHERNLKAAEHAMSEAREARATAQAMVGNVQQGQESLTERILEKCECAPEGLAALAELKDGQPLPEPEAIEARLSKLLREREALGPVNLRAEQEAEEQQTQMDMMNKEKADLLEAIAKLRSGINSLNREARERLGEAFAKVQGHFKGLFTTLFGGGQAELKLTEAEDPLEAGLEIIASPPGKKFQNLSLLSGGEQALTSLALLFAVFLVNPSPICVLDEVDAPLDEANIDRFCNLLEQMSREGKTRFLVITHQRLTMSRMDRLYGVTMMEKGVSKLVSVDMTAAEAITEGLAA